MAGTITNPDPPNLQIGESPSYIYDMTLTLDGDGNCSGNPLVVFPGYLTAVDTIPDGDHPPTEGYQLKLNNSYGVDILAGDGVSRSATFPERLQPKPSPFRGNLFPVIASGGANAQIRLMIYVQGV